MRFIDHFRPTQGKINLIPWIWTRKWVKVSFAFYSVEILVDVSWSNPDLAIRSGLVWIDPYISFSLF